MANVMTVAGGQGFNFNVRVVTKGENYGLNNALTHKHDEPMVEFYDARHAHTKIDSIVLGQFVSRYNLSIINGTSQWSSGDLGRTGLCLMGYEPKWTIDAAGMKQVLAWLAGL